MIKIAQNLEVSVDYLVGLTQSKTGDINSKVEDHTNDILDKLHNDTLGIADMLLKRLDEEEVLMDLKAYVFVSYINENILTKMLENIEDEVKRKVDIMHMETQKIKFLMEYMEYFRFQKTTYYSFAHCMAQNHKSAFDKAKIECEKILYYNQNKDIQIDFARMTSLQIVLKLFETHLLKGLEERTNRSNRKHNKRC